MKTVREECEDSIDRSWLIPLGRVEDEEINLNADGSDTIMANGEYYICFDGMFQISDLSFLKIEKLQNNVTT